MPTRYLRPGIRDSEAIDKLAPMAEVLFYRLLVTVDDFGRADARPAMIKAQCFPIRDSVTADKCAALLAELDAKGLVQCYSVDGKPYLQMLKWENVPRAKASKFPQQPAATDACTHVHADARKPRTHLPETVTGTETETDNPPSPRRRGAVDKFPDFWLAWPRNERKQDKKKCEGKWKALGLDKVADTILRDVKAKKLTRKWVDGYVEAPLVYIHNARWEDGASKASALKPGSDEYMQAHKNASWWKDAGFSSVYEAANKRCWHHNAKDFANGAKKEMA